jgi:CIC family chloride channel protein
MTFLALESTENFSVTMAVLAASIVAAITVRRLFGYSFTTWRFHLRGESIRSAVDVGWIQNLTVGTMMRRAETVAPAEMTLAAFRLAFPLGATQRVIVVNSDRRYAGLVYPPEAFGIDDGNVAVRDIMHHSNEFLYSKMNVKEAIAVFEAAEADALAVLDGPETRLVLGLLTEQFALKRYAEELERRRQELSGEG